jgi:hypothetical protein
MFRHTCVVNAFRTSGTGGHSLSSSNDGGSEMELRVLHRVGELDVLRYACALWSWSCSMDDNSSREASLSLKGASASRLHILRKIHCPASRPQSRSNFLSSCDSSRNKMPTQSPKRTTAVQKRLGSRYGNAWKIVPSKTWGHATAGRARKPPRNPPMIVLRNSGQSRTRMLCSGETHPRHHTKGMMEYARAIEC